MITVSVKCDYCPRQCDQLVAQTEYMKSLLHFMLPSGWYLDQDCKLRCWQCKETPEEK